MVLAEFEKDRTILKNVKNFDLKQTFDCGQAFRWEYLEDKNAWGAVVNNKYIEVSKSKEDIILGGVNEELFSSFFSDYFDLGRDYSAIIEEISADPILKKAATFGSGIRILNQEPWETLCSFIISQNNNIPRIKGIISRLCENFGEKCEKGYTFPSASKLADLKPEDLSVLRAGFRARYIIDAAKKVASNEIDLLSLKNTDTDSAREQLMKIKGVGPKVADCTLLFGLSHFEAFPKDVWIKRAINDLYGGEIPEFALKYGGIVQQYIFYYYRDLNGNF